MAVKAADYASFEQRRKEAAKRGKLRGIGISTYIEACAMAPSVIAGQLGAPPASTRRRKCARTPLAASPSSPARTATAKATRLRLPSLLADRFGVPLEMVDIVHGDTGQVPFGMGTYPSRSLAVGGTALVKAMDKIVAKAKKIAAHLLEAAEADIEFRRRQILSRWHGPWRAVCSGGLRRLCPAQLSDRHAGARVKRDRLLRSHQLHLSCRLSIAEIEIDREIGTVELINFTGADDFGRIINPLIVEGQVHGALVQGIGQALYENAVYDESGQLEDGLVHGLLHAACRQFPSVQAQKDQHNALHAQSAEQVKGCGEAGTIGAPAAIINAVVDALAHLASSISTCPPPPSACGAPWQLRQVPACSLAARFGAGLSVRGLRHKFLRGIEAGPAHNKLIAQPRSSRTRAINKASWKSWSP